MNRAHIVKAVARTLTTKGEALKAVETVFETIRAALSAGEKVSISNFGTFRVKLRKSRQGRNPKTGEAIAVPPRRGVRFKASKQLLE